MSVCIGIDPYAGKLSAYDMSTMKTTTHVISKISSNESDEIQTMYNTISLLFKRSTVNCISVFLSSYSNNKEFLESGSSHGFKVYLLYWGNIFHYTNMVFLLKNMQHKCDLVWIAFNYECDVWQRQQGSMVFVKHVNNEKMFKNQAFIEEIKKQSGIYQTPDIIMYGRNGLLFNATYLKCKLIPYIPVDKDKSSLIHARFMASDPIAKNFAPITPSTYTIHAIDRTILAQNILLGTNTFFVIDFQNKDAMFECEFNPKGSGRTTQYINVELSHFKGENDGRALVEFVIDINGTYKIKFLDIWKFSETEIEQMKVFFKNVSPSMKNLKFPREFIFPKKLEIYDKSIDAIGIDLGTSRCCCAVNRIFGMETVALDNGQRQLPSYIAFDEKQPKCGKIVMKRMKTELYAKSSIFDFKRIIGRDFDSIKKDINWPFEIEELNVTETNYFERDKHLEDTICHRNSRIKLLGHEGTAIFKSAEQIAAIILQDIKKKSEDFQGRILSQVVITVPAAFNNIKTNAIYRAGKSAGFNTVHLLFEPIAAAFAYFANRPIPENSTMLLFDLGGGTLDICIFTIRNNNLNIINRSGDPNLGGRDFDNILIDYLKAKIMLKFDVEWTHGKAHELMSKCQEIKECLSIEEYVNIDLDFINPSVDEYLPLTRKAFEEMSTKLLHRIEENILRAIQKTGLSVNKIDKVLYAGGGCRMPMVKALLKELFPTVEHCCDINPDEVVAIGAAHYSYYLNMQQSKKGKGRSII